MPSLSKSAAGMEVVICSGVKIRRHQTMKLEVLLGYVALVTGSVNSVISACVIIRVLLWPLIKLLTLASHVQAYHSQTFSRMEHLEGFKLHIK